MYDSSWFSQLYYMELLIFLLQKHKMYESRNVLQLQAEVEFERDDWKRRFEAEKLDADLLRSENAELKSVIASLKSQLQSKTSDYAALLSRTKDDSKRIKSLKTSR